MAFVGGFGVSSLEPSSQGLEFEGYARRGSRKPELLHRAGFSSFGDPGWRETTQIGLGASLTVHQYRRPSWAFCFAYPGMGVVQRTGSESRKKEIVFAALHTVAVMELSMDHRIAKPYLQ